MVQACITCDFVSDMHAIGLELSRIVYIEFGGQLGAVVKSGAIAYMLGTAALLQMGHAGLDHVKRMVPTLLAFVMAGVLLADYGILRDWFFGPLENTALRMGLAIMELAESNALDPKFLSDGVNRMQAAQVIGDIRIVIKKGDGGNTAGLYSMMIHVVEILIWDVFRFPDAPAPATLSDRPLEIGQALGRDLSSGSLIPCLPTVTGKR